MKDKESFKCTICGDCPEVFIFYGNAKLRSNIDSVTVIYKDVETDFEGQIDLKQFWEDNCSNVPVRMFGSTSEPKLEFKIAPIMDATLSKDTEFMKMNTLKYLAQSCHKNVPVDEIRYLCLRNKYTQYVSP